MQKQFAVYFFRFSLQCSKCCEFYGDSSDEKSDYTDGQAEIWSPMLEKQDMQTHKVAKYGRFEEELVWQPKLIQSVQEQESTTLPTPCMMDVATSK